MFNCTEVGKNDIAKRLPSVAIFASPSLLNIVIHELVNLNQKLIKLNQKVVQTTQDSLQV